MFKKLEEIEVWKRGSRLTVDVFRLTEKEPLERKWGLCDQVRRSALSIPSNIAEGYERNSRAEFKRFLMIAKGSCGELRTRLYIIKALGYSADDEIDNLIKESGKLSAMIQNLATQIHKSSSK